MMRVACRNWLDPSLKFCLAFKSIFSLSCARVLRVLPPFALFFIFILVGYALL